jgi:DNA-binding GntR family transcriptional regulator
MAANRRKKAPARRPASYERHNLRPLALRHLKDEAYDVLKAAITSLALPPGAPCMEAEMAAQLGISKTPVRHALARLENEGLVTTIPFKGTFVRGVSLEDVNEIFDIRRGLESLAVRIWVERVPASEINELKRIIERTEAAASREGFDAAMASIREFHDVLIARTGNERLVAIFGMLDDQLLRVRNICGHIPGRIEQSCVEHRAVIAALEARDAGAAEEETQRHLDSLFHSYSDRAGEVMPAMGAGWLAPRLSPPGVARDSDGGSV